MVQLERKGWSDHSIQRKMAEREREGNCLPVRLFSLDDFSLVLVEMEGAGGRTGSTRTST